jgi:hypothetical protein
VLPFVATFATTEWEKGDAAYGVDAIHHVLESRCRGNATPSFEETTTEAIAWVHRHGGALGDAAPSIELIERHRDELGVDWMLLRCSGDGRRTILERRTDGDRWWLHVEQESVGGDEEPRLSDVRSRSRWQTRPGIRTVTIPARSLRGLRDELQKWRQQASG